MVLVVSALARRYLRYAVWSLRPMTNRYRSTSVSGARETSCGPMRSPDSPPKICPLALKLRLALGEPCLSGPLRRTHAVATTTPVRPGGACRDRGATKDRRPMLWRCRRRRPESEWRVFQATRFPRGSSSRLSDMKEVQRLKHRARNDERRSQDQSDPQTPRTC
jgi:hypothetical protein